MKTYGKGTAVYVEEIHWLEENDGLPESMTLYIGEDIFEGYDEEYADDEIYDEVYEYLRDMGELYGFCMDLVED